MVDSQVQRNHTVTTCDVTTKYSVSRLIGALIVGDTVDPSEAVASKLLVNAIRGLVNGQVQRHHAVATCHHGSQGNILITCIGEGLALPSIRQLAFTDSSVIIARRVLVDRQVQGHHTVATSGITARKSVRVFA